MAEAVGYPAIECASERLAERSLVLKHDRLFMLADLHGNIAPAGRLLARPLPGRHPDPEPLRALGARWRPPDLLSAQVPRAYGAQIDLAINDLPFGGDPWDPEERGPHPARAGPGRPAARSGSPSRAISARRSDYWIELALGCDFADIFEVRGWRREERGQYFAPGPAGDRLVFALPWPRRPPAADAWSDSASRPTASPSGPRGGTCASSPTARSSSNGRSCADGRRPSGRHGPPAALDEQPSRPRPRYRAWHEAEQPVDHRRRRLRRPAAPRRRRPAGALRRGRRRRRDLGRHPVVLDGVRPRLDHHLAADPAAPARHRARHAALPGPPPGRSGRTRTPRSSPGRSCTSSAAARWPGAARSRTCPTTAASTPRRSG